MTLSPQAALIVPAANTALLCVVLVAWSGEAEETHSPRPAWLVWSSMINSSLLAFTLLVEDSSMRALGLLGAAVATTAVALGPMQHALGVEDVASQSQLSSRVAGGIKHLSLASIGTILLVVGVLLIARYPFAMEDSGLLQTGVGLVAVGLLVRSGAMPFSAPFSDLVRSTPGTAILALGATVPVVLMSGLLILSPLEGSLARGAYWVGAVAAFASGVRALCTGWERRLVGSDRWSFRDPIAVLVASSISLQTAWVLFGVLSGSKIGATGAVLLATNIALAATLLVVSCELRAVGGRWAGVGLAAGAVATLGLPPLGGFAGTLLIAQAAANAGGLWLALLLFGSILTAAGWLTAHARSAFAVGEEKEEKRPTLELLVWTLIAAEVALFLAAGPLAEMLGGLTTAPWLVAP